jgi:Bacteriophage lambda head decoration protein D
MALYTLNVQKPKLQSQWLKWFTSEQYSMEGVTLGPLAGPADTGTVLGLATATGLWAPLNLAASDGTQVAAGVLLEAMPTNAGNTLNVPIVVRQAVAKADGLIWPAGITPAQIATATAQLFNGGNGVTLGIVVRSAS